MVKRNDYQRKNFSKDGVQNGEHVNSNAQQKPFQKDAEVSHKDNHVRNNRPPRDNQQRENNNQSQRRENRDNQGRDNSQRENNQNQHKENFQRNYHRDRDNQNREGRENREPVRQHFQRPAIKPRAEETVADITADISRIEKEIELELKEIRSIRLGV